MTNGEAFQKLMREVFPKIITIYGVNERTQTVSANFSKEWWDSPYREEKQGLAFADQDTLQSAT